MKKDIGFQETIAWYEANAPQYTRTVQNLANVDLIDQFVQAVGPGGRVLDVGCAGGRDAAIFKESGLDPVGIDISTSMIHIARENNRDIEFYLGNFIHMPFPNQSFDGVWAHACLLHLETVGEVVEALKEFYRVLKPKGILHVFVKKQQGKDKTMAVIDSISGHKRFFQFFSSSEIKKLVTEQGFEIIEQNDNHPDNSQRKEVVWIHILAKKV